MSDASDASLRWHRTTLDGRVACYGEAGDGPPLVFIHGWGLKARTYGRVLPQLARAGVRVIAPALPGFGRSDALGDGLTWENLAEWLADLLDHVGVHEPAFLVGHSFGGAVATATAWYHPEVARSLVLVNSVGGSVWTDGDGDREARHLADRPIWDWGIHFPADLRAKSVRRVVPVIARDFVGNAMRNPRALARAANLARTADLREELAELAERGLPVTVLWGDQDRVVPEAAFAASCAAAGATGDIIRDAGHAWLLADPESFGEIMTNSLTIHSLLERRARDDVGAEAVRMLDEAAGA